VVIQKTGNDNYVQIMAYLVISLQRSMGNLATKVVVEVSSEEAGSRGQLSYRPFGGRKRHSAIDAVAIMVDRALAAWTSGCISCLVQMDSTAALQRVAKESLVSSMKINQIDRDLTQLMELIHSERTVEMIIEGTAMNRHLVEAGVTQCSPVSLNVFASSSSGLVNLVKEYLSPNRMSFVDD